ncbi:MAG: type II toxin-antitoxin system VapC family toxin [Acidobacteriota bacterium]|nr:type II toxin-antitoxin system VapC family toxin [Acidobacteriota bacterium]
MIVYLDTSSLVKLYVEEKGSRLVRDLVERAELVATSVVTYAEARAAFARQRREGGLTLTGFRQAKQDFDQDWPRYLAVEVNETVYRRAGDLAEKHHLRGFDSLHLAAYLSLCEENVRQVRFSSFDKSLNRAARKETTERSPKS